MAGAVPVSYGLLAPFPTRGDTQGTWVADVVLFRKIGRLLGGFKAHQQVRPPSTSRDIESQPLA